MEKYYLEVGLYFWGAVTDGSISGVLSQWSSFAIFSKAPVIASGTCGVSSDFLCLING